LDKRYKPKKKKNLKKNCQNFIKSLNYIHQGFFGFKKKKKIIPFSSEGSVDYQKNIFGLVISGER
jgi:hypothetical protein